MGAVSSLFGACRSYLAPYTAEGAVNASALLQAAQSGDSETGKQVKGDVCRLTSVAPPYGSYAYVWATVLHPRLSHGHRGL